MLQGLSASDGWSRQWLARPQHVNTGFRWNSVVMIVRRRIEAWAARASGSADTPSDT